MNGKRKFLLLLLLFLILVNSIVFTISKCIIKESKTLGTNVSKPVIRLENNTDLDLTNDNLYNSKKFNIMNYTNNEINEVSLSYYIEIVYTDIDTSQIEITLTRNNKNVIITDNITETFPLKASEKQNDQFILNVNYKNGSDIKGKIELKLYSYQNPPEVAS